MGRFRWMSMVCMASLLCLVSVTEANIWNVARIPENKTGILESWKELEKQLKNGVNSLIKKLLPTVIESSGALDISPDCMKQSLYLVSGLRKLKKYAFQIVDANAKLLEGAMSGSVTFLGVYEQCLEVVVPNARNANETFFKGQYCSVDIRPPLPAKRRIYHTIDTLEELANFTGSEVVKTLTERAHLFYFIPIKMGLCVPSGCNEKDLDQLLNFAAAKLDFTVEVNNCETKQDEVQLDGAQKAAVAISGILGFLVLYGTWIEMRTTQEFNKCGGIRKVFMSFSMVRSFKFLATTKYSNNKFGCIHGIRFLSIAWLVVGNNYIYGEWFIRSYRILFDVVKILTEPLGQMVINSSEVVDSFLFISGLLTCYVTINHVKNKNKSFSLNHYVFHRLWRIIPSYYFILLFAMLVPLMGSGPLFQETMQESIYPCHQYWWRNLLFINNFFHMKDLCMMHTWYLSCEVQLYLLGLLAIIPLMRFEKLGIAISIVIVVASIFYCTAATALYMAAPTVLLTNLDPEDRNLGFLKIYASPFARAGPYFIGVVIGYILATRPKIKLSKMVQVIGWSLAIFSSAGIIMAPGFWFHIHFPTIPEGMLYAALNKVAYTLGIAWVTLCCTTGHGGIINKFLSWKVWTPLSRLTFLIYLIQPIFQTVYIANFKTAQQFSHLHMVVQFFGMLCISSLLAFICYLLVESPFASIERAFRKEDESETEYGRNKGDLKEKMNELDDKIYHTGVYNNAFVSQM